jgi:hypothetical protein
MAQSLRKGAFASLFAPLRETFFLPYIDRSLFEG